MSYIAYNLSRSLQDPIWVSLGLNKDFLPQVVVGKGNKTQNLEPDIIKAWCSKLFLDENHASFLNLIYGKRLWEKHSIELKPLEFGPSLHEFNVSPHLHGPASWVTGGRGRERTLPRSQDSQSPKWKFYLSLRDFALPSMFSDWWFLKLIN